MRPEATKSISLITLNKERPCLFHEGVNLKSCAIGNFHTAESLSFARLAFGDESRVRFVDSHSSITSPLRLLLNRSLSLMLVGFAATPERFAAMPGMFSPLAQGTYSLAYRRDLFRSGLQLSPQQFGSLPVLALALGFAWLLLLTTKCLPRCDQSCARSTLPSSRTESSRKKCPRSHPRCRLSIWAGLSLRVLRQTLRGRLVQIFAALSWVEYSFGSLEHFAFHANTEPLRVVAPTEKIRDNLHASGIAYVELVKRSQQSEAILGGGVLVDGTTGILDLACHSCDVRAETPHGMFSAAFTAYTSIPSAELPRFDEIKRVVFRQERDRLATKYLRPPICPTPQRSKALRRDQIFPVFALVAALLFIASLAVAAEKAFEVHRHTSLVAGLTCVHASCAACTAC